MALKHIGIDETSYKKGQYITVIVDHDTNSVIWVHDKHGKEVLREFFEQLREEQRASIELRHSRRCQMDQRDDGRIHPTGRQMP